MMEDLSGGDPFGTPSCDDCFDDGRSFRPAEYLQQVCMLRPIFRKTPENTVTDRDWGYARTERSF